MTIPTFRWDRRSEVVCSRANSARSSPPAAMDAMDTAGSGVESDPGTVPVFVAGAGVTACATAPSLPRPPARTQHERVSLTRFSFQEYSNKRGPISRYTHVCTCTHIKKHSTAWYRTWERGVIEAMCIHVAASHVCVSLSLSLSLCVPQSTTLDGRGPGVHGCRTTCVHCRLGMRQWRHGGSRACQWRRPGV